MITAEKDHEPQQDIEMIKAVIVHAAQANGIPGEDNLFSLPQFKLLGKASSVSEGIHMIRLHKPNLVMLDLEMPGGESWQVFEATKGLSYEKIVFSSNDVSAFRVIRFEIGDQLVKPLHPDALRESVSRIIFNRGEYGIQKLYNQRIRKQICMDQIFLPNSGGMHLVNVVEISRVEGSIDGSMVVFRNGKVLLCKYSIQKMAKLLALSPFFRITSECLLHLHEDVQIEEQGDVFFVHSDLGFQYPLPYQRVNSFQQKLCKVKE